MPLKKGSHSLQELFPTIALEWDNDRNEFASNETAAFSHYKAHWICRKCGYKWKADVNSRTKSGRGCPACGGQVVIKGKNDLKTVFPIIAQEWDYEKNNPTLPEDVSFGSTKKFYWKCPSCGYSYNASANQRTNSKSGCPYCSNHKVMPGFNDLETLHPELADEWDYQGNGDLLPSMVLCNRHKAVSWVCKTCGNRYQAYIYNRLRGDACPYCSGHQVRTGFNDLVTLRPDLLTEWDYEENIGINPNSLTIGSNVSAWWRCSVCGHKWKAPIVRRTSGGQCPKCNHRNHTSFPEQAVFYYIKKIFPDAINGYTQPFEGSMEIDIYLPSMRVGVEYDGIQWHRKEVDDRERRKYNICLANGIKLIRIKEGESDSRNCDIQIKCDYRRRDYADLDETIRRLFLILDVPSPIIDSEKDAVQINEQFITTLRDGSFGEMYPHYCEEWDYEKNGKLTPYMFFPFSNESVWWKCKECGRTYKMTICDKAQGHKCRKCAYKELSAKLGKKVINLDTGLVFESISAAAIHYGNGKKSNVNSISKCCNGQQKTALGYHWSFVE